MNELTLYAQPKRYAPVLSRSDLKKGIYKKTEWGTLAFNDIGEKIYNSALEFDKNMNIKLIRGPYLGIMVNWNVIITGHYLDIKLESRQYYIPWVREGIAVIALKITFRGDNESMDRFVKILSDKFQVPPTDFKKWHKLEKYFNVEQYEVESNWKLIV
jgi:hypothetical protein